MDKKESVKDKVRVAVVDFVFMAIVSGILTCLIIKDNKERNVAATPEIKKEIKQMYIDSLNVRTK